MMNRKAFLQRLAIVPLAFSDMKINQLNRFTAQLGHSEKMPVLFLGHGSPMNAIEDNAFVKGFRSMAQNLPQPQAILCISAHWETRGTYVTAMEQPRTIHDFGGFPKALFDVQYAAPGSPELAEATREMVKTTEIGLDHSWGLDHGAWSVIKHLYPSANVPVIQMSIDYTRPASYHYALAAELASLRKKGVLIVGSGNMVHNLRLVAWDKLNAGPYGYDWALEAREKMTKSILDGDHQPLINFRSQGKAFDLAIPTPEHYLPLLYSLALQEKNEAISIFNDEALAGSLTMTSVKIG